MAYVKIGSVVFERPLMWLTKGEPVIVGSARRTRTGKIISLSVENPAQTHIRARLKFEAITKQQLDTLRAYQRIGAKYPANFEGVDGADCYCRFDPVNGVTAAKNEAFGDDTVHAFVRGKPTDLYAGELNLIIESA